MHPSWSTVLARVTIDGRLREAAGARRARAATVSRPGRPRSSPGVLVAVRLRVRRGAGTTLLRGLRTPAVGAAAREARGTASPGPNLESQESS